MFSTVEELDNGKKFQPFFNKVFPFQTQFYWSTPHISCRVNAHYCHWEDWWNYNHYFSLWQNIIMLFQNYHKQWVGLFCEHSISYISAKFHLHSDKCFEIWNITTNGNNNNWLKFSMFFFQWHIWSRGQLIKQAFQFSYTHQLAWQHSKFLIGKI